MDKVINITPVILCGGSGARLWPLSRSSFPKQFITLTDSESLFQKAINRIKKMNTKWTTIIMMVHGRHYVSMP